MQASFRWTPIKTAITMALCGAALAFTPAIAQQAAAGSVQRSAAAVLPGDDFFGYVNADWLAKTEIPADRSAWSAGSVLAESTNERIVKLIEELASRQPAMPAAWPTITRASWTKPRSSPKVQPCWRRRWKRSPPSRIRPR
jgi:endothelin-converting enzyme/putative endopeptidase